MLDMLRTEKPAIVPPDIAQRIDRGRRVMKRDAAKRRLCQRFEKGDSYSYLDHGGVLQVQSTTTNPSGGGKPEHRIRNKYNMIRPIVEDKVSTATNRTPSYSVAPSTPDENKIAAAKLAEKIAVYGFDRWHLRKMRTKVIKLAITTGEGYAIPYYDPNVGPYETPEVNPDDPDHSPAYGDIGAYGKGEVRWIVLSGNQVMWEPGVDFEQSRWWAMERARPVDELMAEFKRPVKPDATTSDIPTDNRDNENLALVTDYFERPSSNHPNGRWLTLAAGQLLCPVRDYPLTDCDGEVLDEPVILRLVYTVDPETDRDLGLVWQLIDPQRTIQDCWNKLLEWKNRCLNPQMIAQVNSLIDRPTDIPGDVRYYKGPTPPSWEQPPAVPQALFQMLDLMKRDMRDMAAYEDVQAQARLAAATVDAVLQQSQARWGSFLADVAEFDSRFMRHALMLVAQFYEDGRLIRIRGLQGWEPIKGFKGTDLLSEVDVTVNPDTLRYRTRDELKKDIFEMADRMWITPQQAMSAIDNGTAEALIQSYQLDRAKANRIIQRIRNGTVMDMPTRQDTNPDGTPLLMPNPDDPMGPPVPAEVPTYMPDVQDNKDVWLSVFGDWMKTEEYELLPVEMQTVAKQIFQGIKQMKAQEAQQALQQQTDQAQALGLQNATRTPEAKPLPSMPGSPVNPSPQQ